MSQVFPQRDAEVADVRGAGGGSGVIAGFDTGLGGCLGADAILAAGNDQNKQGQRCGSE